MKTKRGFLHFIGYLNCTNNHIRLDLLLILARARLPTKLSKLLISCVTKIKKNVLKIILKKSMKGPVKIFFGQSKTHVRY